MQIKINEEMYHKSPYSDYLLYLFQNTSTETYPDEIDVPNDAWFEFIDLLYKYSGHDIPKKNINNCLPDVHIDNPSRGVMLGFSGGSDSTTHAAYLQDRDDVSEVVLYNMTHLNRSYPNEKNAAKAVADHLNMELILQEMKYSGKMQGIESPVKNHLVLAFMIPEMIKRNIVRCSEGVFPNDTLDVIGGLYGLSDAYDLFKAFEKAIQRTFPQYRFIICFKNWTHEFAYLMKYHKDLVPLYQSCLLPDRYRGKIRKINETKYNMTLIPNRCLSCWKCCKEYTMLGMFNYHKIDPIVYKNQIMPTLRRFYAKEKGISEREANGVNTETILSQFMFLDDIQRYVNDMSLVDKDFEDVPQFNNPDCWS